LSKRDPSKTLWISKKFFAELKKRMNLLKQEVERKILNYYPHITVNVYDFPVDPSYLESFSRWLDQNIDAIIFQAQLGTQARYQRWTDMYVTSAYKQGVTDAYIRGKFGRLTGLTPDQWLAASFSAPIHASRVALCYIRTYESLKNVSQVMANGIRTELAQGMIEGVNPKVVAKRMAEKIDGIGIRRAELIARTEIMRAHSEASLDTYESFEQEGITLLVEYLYANDDRVCDKCVEFGTDENGNPKRFKVSESHGILPLHPNCRCVWIPWIPELDELSRKDRESKIEEISE